MTSTDTSSGVRLVGVTVTVRTMTQLRCFGECFREGMEGTKEEESGLELEQEVGAQTRGGGKGAIREDGELNHPPEEDGPGQSPGLEGEQAGRDQGLEGEEPGQSPGREAEQRGLGPGIGEGGPEDTAPDQRDEEVRVSHVRRRPGAGLRPRVKALVCRSMPVPQCRAS